LTLFVNLSTIDPSLEPICLYFDLFTVEIGGCVLQRLFTFAIVIISILWIVVSYLPGVQAILPTISLVGDRTWWAWLGVAMLVIFIAIQFWLLHATITTVRAYHARSGNASFRLRLGLEFFWTALPIAMSVGLVWASYALWLNLTNH
jgi:hypothetical protein